MENSKSLPDEAAAFVYGRGTVDLGAGTISYADGTRGQLLAQELALLRYLCLNEGRLTTREEILQHVWRLQTGNLETRTVDMHVSKLRRKLKLLPEDTLLQTVRGRGYILQRRREDPGVLPLRSIA
jgi:DNA-binding response OmpR family regulator